MNSRFPLVILAGAGCAFLLPLPRPEPGNPEVSEPAAAPKFPTGGNREPLIGDAGEERKPEPGLVSVAGMDRADCFDVLDSRLGRWQVSPPPLEQEEILTALALRLFREQPVGSPDFPGTRNLPAWLLRSAWLATSKSPAGVPASLLQSLPNQPEGLAAGGQIVESLAASDPESAAAFEKSMPDDWRKSLRESRLAGLAGSHPLEAVQETFPHDPERTGVMMTAIRKGPMDEAVRMLSRYGNDLEMRHMESAMNTLKQRNPAELEQSVEALGDPALTEILTKTAPLPGLSEDRTVKSLSELLTAAKLNPSENSQALATALLRTAVRDPDTTIEACGGLEHKNLKPLLASGMLLQTLAENHPAKALAFAEASLSGSSLRVAAIWLKSDAPGALKAILELPESSALRRSTVDELRSRSHSTVASASIFQFTGVETGDLLLAAQELPSELQRQIQPDPSPNPPSPSPPAPDPTPVLESSLWPDP